MNEINPQPTIQNLPQPTVPQSVPPQSFPQSTPQATPPPTNLYRNLNNFKPQFKLSPNSFSNLNNFNTNTANSTPKFSDTNINKLGTVTTGFGDTTKYEKFHEGVDIANKIGTPIPAFVGGKIIEVDTGKKQGDKGFGNSVVVLDAQGDQHRYSHLNNAWVKVGQVVTAGQDLGAMGNSGSTYSTSGGTGSHLDYRVRDAYNKYVNPYKFFKKSTV